MKHFIISIALVLFVVIAVSGRDRLYIENFRILPGETVRVPVLLLNDTAYSGLQTDLYLPAGLSLDMEDDEYIVDLTSRKDKSHTVVSHQLDNGAIRIYISSVSAREFSGKRGAIMTLSITATDDLAERTVIELKNSVCAEAIGTRHVLDNETCVVRNAPLLPGDVNGDGEVNVADVNAVINQILSELPSVAGDVNRDGEVNIADINTVIDLILNN